MKDWRYAFAVVLVATTVFTPHAAFAQRTFRTTVNATLKIIGNIAILLVAAAVLVFIYGVVKYVQAGDNPNRLAQARNVMVGGIIGIFVMVSVWGLVRIVVNSFDFENVNPPQPQSPPAELLD